MIITCKAKNVSTGKRCKAKPRINGFCTKHFIKKNYTDKKSKKRKVKRYGKK